MTALRVMISAGEASADRLGGALLRALGSGGPVCAMGMGGPELRAAGLEAWYDSDELSVVGLVEVVAHLPRLLRLADSLGRRATDARPDVAVLIDAPDFHLRVARTLRRAGVPVALYVPPQVWASRPGRVRRFADAFDRILVLFPFEVPIWGTIAEAVGHPLIDQIRSPRRPADLAGAPIALLPGSRVGELRRHLPLLVTAARAIADRGRFVVPVAVPALRPLLLEGLRGIPVELLDGPNAVQAAVGRSAGALVASGTATLETALLGCPQVVFYRLHPITYAVARRMMTTDHWALPNVLLDDRVVPECIQDEATAETMAQTLMKQLDRQDEALRVADEVRARLGPSGAALRAAYCVRALAERA